MTPDNVLLEEGKPCQLYFLSAQSMYISISPLHLGLTLGSLTFASFSLSNFPGFGSYYSK